MDAKNDRDNNSKDDGNDDSKNYRVDDAVTIHHFGYRYRPAGEEENLLRRELSSFECDVDSNPSCERLMGQLKFRK